jgi:hypothetical protein
MDDPDDIPPELHDWLHNVIGYRDFVRENFGRYYPPADYKAIRADNLRRTQRALERARGNN